MSARTSTFDASSEQYSIPKSLALHILPGVFIVVVFVLTAPFAMQVGLPPLLPILGSAALGLAFQIWHLYSESRRRNGKWSLDGIILYRRPMLPWQYFALAVGFVILAFIINGLASPMARCC